MSERIERLYPFVSGVSLSILYFFIEPYCPYFGDMDLVFFLSLLIGAISLGYLVNVQSIFLVINDKKIVNQLKDIGKYGLVLKYLNSSFIHILLLFVFSAALLLIDISNSDDMFRILLSFWIFLAICSFLYFFRILIILNKILKSNWNTRNFF